MTKSQKRESPGRFASGGSAKWTFTKHAIERFIERHAPGIGPARACQRLEEAARIAQMRQEREVLAGETFWRVTENLVLVTRDERDEIICVTVLKEQFEPAAARDEAARQLEEDLRRRLRWTEEQYRSARRKLERALKKGEQFRQGLDIAMRCLKAMECLDEAAAALAEIQEIDSELIERGEEES